MSVEYIVYERWETARDDRVCPYCAHLDGAVFRVSVGPVPPQHPNCRCRRVFAYREAIPESPVEPAPVPVPALPPAATPAPVPVPPLFPPLLPPIIILPEDPEPEPPPIRPVLPRPPQDEEDA